MRVYQWRHKINSEVVILHEDITLDVQRVLFDWGPRRRLPAPGPGPATTDNGTTVSLTIIIYEYGYIRGCRWHPDVFLTGGHVHGFRQRLSMLPALLLCAAWQCSIRTASCRTSPQTGPWPVGRTEMFTALRELIVSDLLSDAPSRVCGVGFCEERWPLWSFWCLVLLELNTIRTFSGLWGEK